MWELTLGMIAAISTGGFFVACKIIGIAVDFEDIGPDRFMSHEGATALAEDLTEAVKVRETIVGALKKAGLL